LQERRESLERALEEAVSRAVRDNLGPLQRTADDLQQAYADLIAACSSSRPSNALPAMLRAQTAASSLAAGLSVLSNFVAIALNPREQAVEDDQARTAATAVVELEEPERSAGAVIEAEPERERAREADMVAEASAASEERSVASEAQPAAEAAGVASPQAEPEPEPQIHVETAEPGTEPAAEPESQIQAEVAEPSVEPVLVIETEARQPEPEISEIVLAVPEPEIPVEAVAQVAPIANATSFDLTSFPVEVQDLHRRANRVAKVAMQDIKLLRPKDVQLGREHNDICDRLRSDLDKARKEYDRRFRAIQDHPVDYFHRWMVEILADGRSEALGEYPYPSPVLRH
jgi:hypothetical protein